MGVRGRFCHAEPDRGPGTKSREEKNPNYKGQEGSQAISTPKGWMGVWRLQRLSLFFFFAHSRLRVESWSDYLFHYTRACAGPWPGETYDQYLLNLFDARPLSGHSALETLIRILQEGLIRAGARMVRGPEAVISWSSHPPHELFLMRKWNRALVRWTVEPYGIAVRRGILRSLGAKPAVYGSDQVYSRLVEPERYRFQLSRSAPSASWRHEREWRLRGDLALSSLNPGDGFVFVKTEEEKAKFCSHINPGLSIVALDASR